MKKLCMLTVLFLALTCGIVCYSAGVTPLTFFAALRSSALAAGTGTDAVRIDPRLQPQIAGMCLFHPIRERVKRIGRRRAARTGQIPAPRKEL